VLMFAMLAGSLYYFARKPLAEPAETAPQATDEA
jgi:hypothetical protein